MLEPIALIEAFGAGHRALFLAALRSAMPDEVILPFSEMDPARRAEVKIAIVASAVASQIAALPNLAWLHSLWAGTDDLIRALDGRDLPVSRVVDPEQSRRMGEAVLAWTLYLQRDMPTYAAQQAERSWRQHPYREPSSLHVGLLGLGTMGEAAAARLRDAGFRVSGWSRSGRGGRDVPVFAGEDGLAEVLGASDVVVCLLPATPLTDGLIDARRLGMMKTGAALINFGRGSLVDEGALVGALEAGRLRHAVLDVFAKEPLPATSPLWDRRDVTVLPHISAQTNADSTARVVARNIASYRATGRVADRVEVSRGY